MKKIFYITLMSISLSLALVACTGNITENNPENPPVNQVTPDNTSTNQPQANQQVVTEITLEEAKAIALKHAGLTEDQVSFIKSEIDLDYGVKKYDIEFHINNKEYDYEINATTGEIIGYEKD